MKPVNFFNPNEPSDVLLQQNRKNPSFQSLIRTLIKYLHKNYKNALEVEAKIGEIRLKANKQQRARFNVPGETLVRCRETEFNSFLDKESFETIKAYIERAHHKLKDNKLVSYCQKNTVDKFYKWNNSKIRITFENDQPIKAITKEKLEHLDFHKPRNSKDFRISFSLENEINLQQITNLDKPTHERHKLREHYTFGCFFVDLTKVTTIDEKSNKDNITYEFELEVDTKTLFEQKEKYMKKQENYFEQIASDLLAIFRGICNLLTKKPEKKNEYRKRPYEQAIDMNQQSKKIKL